MTNGGRGREGRGRVVVLSRMGGFFKQLYVAWTDK